MEPVSKNHFWTMWRNQLDQKEIEAYRQWDRKVFVVCRFENFTTSYMILHAKYIMKTLEEALYFHGYLTKRNRAHRKFNKKRKENFLIVKTLPLKNLKKECRMQLLARDKIDLSATFLDMEDDNYNLMEAPYG